MLKLLLVFLGGGCGAVSRHLLGLAMLAVAPAHQPTERWGSIHLAGTLAANVLGCFVIGLVWGRLGIGIRDETRLVLVVGFLGGFTTFSSVGWETINLLGRGQTTLAAAYILTTLTLGLAATWTGHALGQLLAAG